MGWKSNIYVTHIEINVDEYNNLEKRLYQLRLVNDLAIDNLSSSNNDGILLTTAGSETNKSPIVIEPEPGKKKEINVLPINPDLIDYNSDPNNLINNNTLQIIGGIDKFIGLQLKSINPQSKSNEVIITLRGFTSYY